METEVMSTIAALVGQECLKVLVSSEKPYQ